jgi:hypothetical protein
MSDYRFLPPGLGRRLEYSRSLIQIIGQPLSAPHIVVNNNRILLNSTLRLVNPRDPLEFGETCSICIDKYIPFQIIRILGCNHSFHKRCIDKWFKSNKSCGICRYIG